MRTVGGRVIAALSLPFIAADAVLAWSLLTSHDPFAGVLAVIGVLSAGLAALGVYGLVEFGRRGSITWLVPTITIAADARRAVDRDERHRRARGPTRERLEGRGSAPQDALLQLTVRLRS